MGDRGPGLSNVETYRYDALHRLAQATNSTAAGGGQVLQARYSAFGGTRPGSIGTPVADDEAIAFTGQMADRADGWIYDYKGRLYDPYLNRWLSPDSIVPDPTNPQSLNRYSYSYNNPLKYTDPSGHCPNDFCDFWEGFAWQFGSNANPIPSGYVGNALTVDSFESNAKLIGRLAGSVASGVMAAVEIGVGEAGVGGGLAACLETAGGGCVVAAGSAGLVGEGIASGLKAAGTAGNTASILAAKGQGGGRPELPRGKFGSANELGKFMEWGTGKEDAINASEKLTIEKVRASGLSLDDAKQWLQRYTEVFRDNPSNGSAEGRITFMQTFIDLLNADQ